MLEVARTSAPDATFKEARAEALPFKDGWFERVVMWLSSHLVGHEQAFPEARRVPRPGGGPPVVTLDPSYFDAVLLNELFPTMGRGGRGRVSTAEEVQSGLPAGRFV